MESVPPINRFLASMAIDQYHPFFMVKLVKPPFFMLKPPFFMVQPPFSHRFFSRTRHPRLEAGEVVSRHWFIPRLHQRANGRGSRVEDRHLAEEPWELSIFP